MSYIVKRAKLTKGEKFFGVLHDRIVVGRSAYRNNFTPLDANDPRKDVMIKTTDAKPNAYFENFDPTGDNFERFEKDYNRGLFFNSNAIAGPRGPWENTTSDFSQIPLGRFHTNITFTIDSSGTGTDLLAPNDVLFLSTAGVLHRLNQTTGEIEVVKWTSEKGTSGKPAYWASGQAANVGTDSTDGWSGVGITVGFPYELYNNMISGPWAFTDISNHSYMIAQSKMTANRQMYYPLEMNIIGQDATYIYVSVCKATRTVETSTPLGTLSGWSGNQDSSYTPGIPLKCVVAIRKSDGFAEIFGRSQNHTNENYTQIATSGHNHEIDPHGNLMCFRRRYSASNSNGYLSFCYCNPSNFQQNFLLLDHDLAATNNSVIAPKRWTGPTRFMDSRPDTGTAAKVYWMESVDYNHPDPSYPNTHCPVIMMLKWTSNSTTLATGTSGLLAGPVQCTLTGLPPEYEGEVGANTLKCLLTHSSYDRYEMFEIEDGGEQYVVLWMGATRSEMNTSDVDTYSNSDDATSEFYRYCLVFKVDSADDSILEYVSDVGDFKYKKPMYMAVATDDNKTIVFADRNGVHPMRWNGATESFAALDPILLENTWALGMSPGSGTSYATCWVEAIDPFDGATTHGYTESPSSVYQLQIGDYKDVDLKYIDADTVEHLEFSSNLLLTEKDVNGDYIAKSFDILVRVKSQTGETVTDFDTGNSVAFEISGGNMETDGLYIDGYDSGNPYLKTITSGADWVTVTVHYRLPLTRVTLSAAIV